MKLSLLNSREAFGSIFARSLERFARSFLSREVDVVPSGEGDLAYRQNAQLNLIYPVSVQAPDLRTLSAEYRFASRLAKRLAQSLYSTLAVTRPTSMLLSPRAFDLRNPAPEMARWVFLPGNHTIRVVDLGNDRSLVFAKEGFDEHFLLNDARVRANHPELPAPRVLKISESGGWYIEERVVGLPINRISDQQRIEAAVGDAVRGLDLLRRSSAQTVGLRAYGRELIGRIASCTPEDPLLATKVNDLTRLVAQRLVGAQDLSLTLCRGHGDLQPANILVSPSRTWLIDWEYSEVRSAIYDYLVFASRSRFAEGLGARILLERERARSAGGVNAWGFQQTGEPEALLSIFLLEDLHLRLREVATDKITDKGPAVVPWLQQAASALRAF